jgi:DNA (cytosine-5)-methyltransferase 1
MAAVELLEGQIHVPGRSRATTVSLFCGGGGETAGKVEAFRELGIDIAGTRSLAVNHWDLACLAHKRNYPWIPVKREDITQVTAADFGLKTINLLWASPSCVHHSRARGGRPKSDQQRAHAWEVLDRWLKVASVDVLLIENVPEFVEWGPLHDTHSAGCDGEADVCLDGCHFNTPIRARRGESFQAFLAELREMGYEVDWRLICAADYGDATIRQRFFLQAVRDGRPIRWPEPTHQNPKGKGIVLDPRLLPWRWGAECIDWSLPLCSIFADRTEAKAWAKQNGYKQPPRRPLADKTMARIAQGVDRFVLKGEPFIAPIQATGGRNEEKVAAFIAKHYGGVVGIRPDQPLGTVTSVDHHAIVAASLIRTDMHKSNAGCAYPLDEPLRTVTTAAGTPWWRPSSPSTTATAGSGSPCGTLCMP